MRRSTVGPTTKGPGPTITLNVPPLPTSRHDDLRSGSAASSQEAGTEAASTVYGGQQATAAWESAADYKDTVMFLSQQQSMQNREIMDVLRHIAASLQQGQRLPAYGNQHQQHHANGAGSSSPPTGGSEVVSPTGPHVPTYSAHQHQQQQAFVSSHDHQLQRLLDYGQEISDPSAVKEITLERFGGYTGSQSTWFNSVSGVEVELHAAKSRIAQLESINRLLQRQLEQKEETIQRLTNANIAALGNRVLASPQQQQQQLIANHHSSTLSSTPPASVSSPLQWHMEHTATPTHRIAGGATMSPYLQQVIQKHNHTPSQQR